MADHGWNGDTGIQASLRSSTRRRSIKPPATFEHIGLKLGITDKYWAAVVIPEQGKAYEARFQGTPGEPGRERFQTDYLMGALTVAPGASAETKGFMFAGAKSRSRRRLRRQHGIPKFDLLIDWGWFYFLTKPLFFALDFFYKLVGNFGLAILIVTLCISSCCSR